MLVALLYPKKVPLADSSSASTLTANHCTPSLLCLRLWEGDILVSRSSGRLIRHRDKAHENQTGWSETKIVPVYNGSNMVPKRVCKPGQNHVHSLTFKGQGKGRIGRSLLRARGRSEWPAVLLKAGGPADISLLNSSRKESRASPEAENGGPTGAHTLPCLPHHCYPEESPCVHAGQLSHLFK